MPELYSAAPAYLHGDATEREHYQEAVSARLLERRASIASALVELDAVSAPLARSAELLITALRSGAKVLVAGNGGSAAEAQHFAAELVGRFQRVRAPYAALALTTDSSILTAVANDFGYQHVFERQVLGLGHAGDILLIFSTSGESENVVRAAIAAHGRDMVVIAVTGEKASSVESWANVTVRVPGTEASAVQEIHMVVTHILCGIVESELAGSGDAQ